MLQLSEEISLLPSFNSNWELYLEGTHMHVIKVQYFRCFGSPNLFQVRVIKVTKEKKYNPQRISYQEGVYMQLY